MARGYHSSYLLPIFKTAIERIKKPQVEEQPKRQAICLHLHFNPCDPSSRFVQQVAAKTLIHPPGERPLHEVENRDDFPIGTQRLIVAYHQPYNLKNRLSPRKLWTPDDMPVSSIVAQVRSSTEDQD